MQCQGFVRKFANNLRLSAAKTSGDAGGPVTVRRGLGISALGKRGYLVDGDFIAPRISTYPVIRGTRLGQKVRLATWVWPALFCPSVTPPLQVRGCPCVRDLKQSWCSAFPDSRSHIFNIPTA